MFDILTLVPGKKKSTGSGWCSFNAPCCHHRGHKADKRGRGGIKFSENDNWSYHCFNCNFKCGFTLGKSLSSNLRQFLVWCGVDNNEITKWNFESLRHKDLLELIPKKKKHKIKFDEIPLPEGAELIDTALPEHQVYTDYLVRRGISPDDFPFLVTPNDIGRYANRIIIPYTYGNKIVGHTSRFLDDRKPKFLNVQQPGYVFGYDWQKPNWQVCIVVEGIFDALSLNACAIMHDDINEDQAELLRRLHRKIIVVPDQDKTGLKGGMCEKALDLGFQISIPDWEEGIKDVNDAVVKYGKLPTLLSILQNATSSKIKMEMKRKKLDKRLYD